MRKNCETRVTGLLPHRACTGKGRGRGRSGPQEGSPCAYCSAAPWLSRSSQRRGPAGGPSKGAQQEEAAGGSPTRFQLPVPKRHSPEVLSIDLHTVHCSTALCEALEQHACIVSSSFVMHIALFSREPSHVTCRGNIVIKYESTISQPADGICVCPGMSWVVVPASA